MTLSEIKADCIRKSMTAMAATVADVRAMLPDVMATYYTGSPEKYVRTGALMNAPKAEGPSGGGLEVSMKAYLDEGFNTYPEGRFNSGADVIEATNEGMRMVVGTTGYWEKMEENTKKIADFHYAAMFG